MNAKIIAFWIVTVLYCLGMAMGGVMDLMHAKDVMDALKRLGYPDYLATILGVAKLLGVTAVLLPGLRRPQPPAAARQAVDRRIGSGAPRCQELDDQGARQRRGASPARHAHPSAGGAARTGAVRRRRAAAVRGA